MSQWRLGNGTLKINTMIKPEEDLELSIKALEVYPIEPAIIKSMLSNLHEVVKQNCNLQNVRRMLPEHKCKYCGCMTRQPDSECYAKPK